VCDCGSTRGRNVGSSVFFAHRGHQIGNGEAKYYVRIRRPNYRKTEKDREKSRRTIPIPPTCLTALRHHKARQAEEKLVFGKSYQDYGLVFSRPDGRPIAPTEFSRHFGRLLKRAGLSRIRLHDAHHTYATMMLELGEGPRKWSRVCLVTVPYPSHWTSTAT